MRTPVIAANWKMHKTNREAEAFARKLVDLVKDDDPVDIVVAPPFTALGCLAAVLRGSAVALGAQNVHAEPQGAFTGEVSLAMLQDLGCRYVIVGHSERRALFAETSEAVGNKVRAVQAGGLIPIVCVGERLEDREAGRAERVLGEQLSVSLAGASAALVVAYEPVWAIGTGRTATPEMAQDAHAFIRGRLRSQWGEEADRVRIQYGGSVKPENAGELLGQPDVDGALVGGASLDPGSFSAIIRSYPDPQEGGR